MAEGWFFTFRAEAFNLTNRMRYLDPAVPINTATTFGTIRAAYDPRIVQFAARFTF